MSKADTIISNLKAISDNPKKAVEDYMSKTGKKAVGFLPVYAPEEIIYAAGVLPVGCWGKAQKNISKANTYLPAFACSIMQSIMEMEIDGVYDVLSAVVVSSLCDTLKCMGQKWKGTSPVIQFVHPQNRNLDSANDFLVEEYKLIRSKLEKILSVEITDAAINSAIDVYNENRQVMREFAAISGDYSKTITPAKRHAIIKSRFFMDRAEHTAVIKELIAELKSMPKEPAEGKKVILTGITAEPDSMLDIFQEFGLTVVADDLAQESRQFRVDVPEGNEPLMRLAKQWQDMYGCSLATDRDKARIPMLVDMVKDTGADAVIVCMMKFCDPEEFDYPLIYQKFNDEGIKSLMIEVDQQAGSMEQIRTRVQSFVEMF
ncbi:MAG: 2-hydroxyacyl-CoA dehydratase [Firmicutes bacterium]|nr:2-hydroxyacyl-CoA dehydratase [Bacillota bacterium]